MWWYVNCAIALNVEVTELFDEKLLRWHATPLAPAPPDEDFLADRYERAVYGADE